MYLRVRSTSTAHRYAYCSRAGRSSRRSDSAVPPRTILGKTAPETRGAITGERVLPSSRVPVSPRATRLSTPIRPGTKDAGSSSEALTNVHLNKKERVRDEEDSSRKERPHGIQDGAGMHGHVGVLRAG